MLLVLYAKCCILLLTSMQAMHTGSFTIANTLDTKVQQRTDFLDVEHCNDEHHATIGQAMHVASIWW